MPGSTVCRAPHSCPLGGDYWVNEVLLDHSSTSTGPEVWGIADTHAHMMAHCAFGERVISGLPDGPLDQALGSCRPQHGLLGLNLSGLIDGPHRHDGYPNFSSWPSFSSITHQQMYVDWIRRAYHGGLRLIVSLAVDNLLLARLAGAHKSWNERLSILEQLNQTRAFAQRHSDFMEIAYTPRQARRIIRENRLAVVLGVEVDGLAMTGLHTPHQRHSWLNQLYHDHGVRHIFPIHLTDNLFGGAAIYDERFDFANFFVNRKPFDLDPSPANSLDFRFGLGFTGCAFNLLRRLLRIELPDRSLPAHANALGLTPIGRMECFRP